VSFANNIAIKSREGEIIDSKNIDIKSVTEETLSKVKAYNKKRTKETSPKK
jgi:hypothetical protein